MDWTTEKDEIVHRFPSHCITLLRLFYLESSVKQKEYPLLCIKDFVPKVLTEGSFFTRPAFEPLADVIIQANDWLLANPEAIYRNGQTLEVCSKSMSKIETNAMTYLGYKGNYVRFFRLYYLKSCKAKVATRKEGSRMSYKVFLPLNDKEGVQELRRRVEIWIARTTKSGMVEKVLSAHSVQVFSKNFLRQEMHLESESTFKFNRVSTKNCFLFNAIHVLFETSQVAAPIAKTNANNQSSFCSLM